MKNITIDRRSIEILKEVKKIMNDEGIETPSYSDAIRYMYGRMKK